MTTPSQNAMILSWLKRGRSLTPLDALERFGCFRLGARVHDLRNDGHPIKRTMIETRSGKRVAKYSLPRKAA